MNNHLIIGGIYQIPLSDAPCRIIALDDIEVFYDAYWPSLDEWTFSSNLKRRGCYYRAPTRYFLKNATFIREQPLTSTELSVFRGDLPFRLCRNKKLVWTAHLYFKLEDYEIYINKLGITLTDNVVLPIDKVILQPFGPKGGPAKSTFIVAAKQEGFSCIELLWSAHNLQAPHIRKQQEGVGIYRKGHEKNVPIYYIGGYYDAANFLPGE